MAVSHHNGGSDRDGEDRRKSRRLDVSLPVILSMGSAMATGHVANLSCTGLCIESDKTLADLLIAAVRGTAGSAPGVVQLRFEVPAGGEDSVPVTVQARTVYVTHDHDDRYRCGLEFRIFLEGGEAFEQHLRECGMVD